MNPRKRHTKGNASIHPEGIAVNKQEEKKITKRNLFTNKLYTEIGHPGEDMMRPAANNLHYCVKGKIEVCEDFDMEKSEDTLLHKVTQ